MGIVLVVIAIAVAFGTGLKVAYGRGLAIIPESAKPKFGLAEALQLKPILDKLGATSAMAEYTTKLVAMLGAVNNLATDVAAVVADRNRQIKGSQQAIAANEAAIKQAQAAIVASGKAIEAAAAAKGEVIALGKLFGV